MTNSLLENSTTSKPSLSRKLNRRAAGLSADNRLRDLPGSDIRVAIDVQTLDEIKALRKKHYREIYPDMELDNDELDQHGLVLYTRDSTGAIVSTARLAHDGPDGLPEEQHLRAHRARGIRLVEWGRFIIASKEPALLQRYYQSVYTLSVNMGFDAIVMAMKPKDVSLHQRLMGLEVVAEDTGVTYGGPYSLACVIWDLTSTKPQFFEWLRRAI